MPERRDRYCPQLSGREPYLSSVLVLSVLLLSLLLTACCPPPPRRLASPPPPPSPAVIRISRQLSPLVPHGPAYLAPGTCSERPSLQVLPGGARLKPTSPIPARHTCFQTGLNRETLGPGLDPNMTGPANPSEGGPEPAAIASAARDPGVLPFVTPSTYLARPHLRAPVAQRPTASSHSRTDFPLAEKPLMTPIDRDQVQGLVSNQPFQPSGRGTCPPRASFLSPSPALLAMDRHPDSSSTAGATSAKPLPAALAAGSIQRGSTSSRILHEGAGYCRRAWRAR